MALKHSGLYFDFAQSKQNAKELESNTKVINDDYICMYAYVNELISGLSSYQANTMANLQFSP